MQHLRDYLLSHANAIFFANGDRIARSLYLSNSDGEHGDRASVNSLYGETYTLARPALTDDVEQRQIMFRRRNGERRVASQCFVSDERGVVIAYE